MLILSVVYWPGQKSLKYIQNFDLSSVVMSLVRPSLEYASAAWSPYTDTDVKRLEQVQKSAARFVCGDYKLTTSTTGLVKGLGWETLEDRRLLNQSALF